jgi:hypothetical protein
LFSNAKPSCNYDECTIDDDCGGTAVCGCRLGAIEEQNICLRRSTCRTDADCGTGRCLLSLLPGTPLVTGDDTFASQVAGYFCTSPGDECHSYDDCPTDEHSCVYYEWSQHFACRGGPCALVDDARRVVLRDSKSLLSVR